MSNNFIKSVVDPEPISYSPPPFPSLYWPFPINGAQVQYLYDADSMWRFTFYWTIICVGAVHSVASGYACVVQHRNWKMIWVAPVAFLLIGGAEACIAGNVVGGLLSGVYSSGSFRMSTWIPLTWGIINALVLILASFAIQGGL